MNRLLSFLAALVATSACLAQAPAAPVLKDHPAARVAHASTAAMLGSARAGQRLVAVGDHGVVLLSDDEGASWRQAQAVPVRSVLTAVSFADAKQGWAVGHWGVILHTADGGETWTLQRRDVAQDRPLFAVLALDPTHVVAVGLWSLVLTSDNGGQAWQTQALDAPPSADGSAGKHADLNLFSLFSDAQGHVYAAGERGMVLRSADQGRHWTYLPTGYKGSFWTGASPAPGVLVVAGLRGSIYRSTDGGARWARVDGKVGSSLTAAAADAGALVLVGLDGAMLRSPDGGATFSLDGQAGRPDLTTVQLLKGGRALALSRSGVLPAATGAAR